MTWRNWTSRVAACVFACTVVLVSKVLAQHAAAFVLAPAVAVEAEEFEVASGWTVVKMGEGNYSVDIIGFSHAGGERFLQAKSDDSAAAAHMDITVPQGGPYRLWVRYEYMPFTEMRFRAAIEQGGKVVAEKVMGAKDNPRWAFGEKIARPQYDPPWGNEGLVEELLEVPNLSAGPARLILATVEQPQAPGRSANRNIDLVYLSADLKDGWRDHYTGTIYYPILDAFRDTRGPRYEGQITNRGDKPLSIRTSHYYNRNQFYDRYDPAAEVKELAPGATSPWLPMPLQDTTHFGMTTFWPDAPQAFTAAVRPIGAAEAEETIESAGEPARVYIPPYPGRGEKAVAVYDEVDAVLKHLADHPAPGKVPTRPLCYGWTVPFTEEDSPYGQRQAKLWAALGMRSYLSGHLPTPVGIKNLEAAGVPLTKSVGYIEYRFPPTPENVAKARAAVEKAGALDKLRWFDYGDEIAFSEWVSYMLAERRAASGNKDLKDEQILRPMWREWLEKNRPGFKGEDYWRDEWGPSLDASQLRPDSSAAAAAENPRLYVDSVIFYEDTAIDFVARGAKHAKSVLGQDVLCGANYSGYPFYYPHSTMYIKWFRDGAADFGRHSEYFWQLGQVTPMINGLFSEYFRCGMRNNPKAVVKQYTMPHSPGNTDASFRRTAFTHLAHGVKNLDFFGTGMNETFTENYIDHRDHERFRAIRDVTHSMALVEDVLEQSSVVPSDVALLVSESTERWDWSGIATDLAGHSFDIKDSAFRKARLTHHQDRSGIYTALTFAGASPDLLAERDLTPEVLKGYKVLYVVGDSVPATVVPALEAWVNDGGVLFATAGVGRYGAYREPNPELQALLGIQSRKIEERDTFVRTAQELPFLKPLATVALAGAEAQEFPALATHERFEPVAGGETIAAFDDRAPAVVGRTVGKGKVYYAATLPGMAYLYKGVTTPKIHVPDRGPAAHRAVNTYAAAAASLIIQPLKAAGVTPRVRTEPGYIDTRLIEGKSEAGKSVFFLPVSNYNETVDQPVTLTVTRPAGAAKPAKAVSAFAGNIAVTAEKDAWKVTLPKLGYGDLIRIDTE